MFPSICQIGLDCTSTSSPQSSIADRTRKLGFLRSHLPYTLYLCPGEGKSGAQVTTADDIFSMLANYPIAERHTIKCLLLDAWFLTVFRVNNSRHTHTDTNKKWKRRTYSHFTDSSDSRKSIWLFQTLNDSPPLPRHICRLQKLHVKSEQHSHNWLLCCCVCLCVCVFARFVRQTDYRQHDLGERGTAVPLLFVSAQCDATAFSSTENEHFCIACLKIMALDERHTIHFRQYPGNVTRIFFLWLYSFGWQVAESARKLCTGVKVWINSVLCSDSPVLLLRKPKTMQKWVRLEAIHSG